MRGQLPGSPKTAHKSFEDAAKNIEVDELELLYDKERTCPVCGKVFTSKEIMTGKAMSEDYDMDLRPKFKNIDPIKYRVIECPACGYADISRTFSNIMKSERAILIEKRLKYEPDAPSEVFAREYTDSYKFYKSAMRCCMIRSVKNSKRAYTALYTAWLLRGWRESIRSRGYSVSDQSAMSMDEERKLLRYSWKHFREAVGTEGFPMAGMDEPTYNYLMASLAYQLDELEDAGMFVLRALQSKELMAFIQPKAEALRDEIRAKRRSMATLRG